MRHDNMSLAKRSRTQMMHLRALSTNLYNPEAPEKSLLVNLFMRMSRMRQRQPEPSPHLFGGSDTERVAWEYNAAPAFFHSIRNYISPDVLDGKHVLDAGCGWGRK